MKALVLGAKSGTNNIGQAVVDRLNRSPVWEAIGDDCWDADAQQYLIPSGRLGETLEESDALVVTLGATAIEPFHETRPGTIYNIIFGGLYLPLIAAERYVKARLKRGEGGRIVFTGSYAHRHPFTSGTAYCAAKAGLEQATKTLGWELTDKGFYTYIIHPYHVEGTPMWERVQKGVMEDRGWTREQADEYAVKDRKLNKLMTPQDFAAVCQWLLSSPVTVQLSGSGIEMFGGTR